MNKYPPELSRDHQIASCIKSFAGGGPPDPSSWTLPLQPTSTSCLPISKHVRMLTCMMQIHADTWKQQKWLPRGDLYLCLCIGIQIRIHICMKTHGHNISYWSNEDDCSRLAVRTIERFPCSISPVLYLTSIRMMRPKTKKIKNKIKWNQRTYLMSRNR